MKEQIELKDFRITQARLKQLVSYDPDSGKFTRISSKWAKLGEIKGTESRGGYLSVNLDEYTYPFHRLAWLYVYGEHPSGSVDHIDGDRGNNRIANLRVVTPSENGQNRRVAGKNNRSGLLGVSKRKKSWVAMITLNRVKIYLGTFTSAELAHEAYLLAKRELHPCSMNHKGAV